MSAATIDSCLACLRELLADEPELLHDVDEAARTASHDLRLPRDIDAGLAGPVWENLAAHGLVTSPGPLFVHRTRRRCEDCADVKPWSNEWCSTCGGTRSEIVDTRESFPQTIHAAFEWATAPDAFAPAEALAHEAAARLWPWRGRRGDPPTPGEPPQRIAWRIDPERRTLELVRPTPAPCPVLFEALHREAKTRRRKELLAPFERMSQPHYPGGPERWWHRPTWPPAPDVDRSARELYRELVDADAIVPRPGLRGSLPAFAPSGRRFAELPNPFEPLCALAELGMQLERIEPDALVLACPSRRLVLPADERGT